VRREPALPLCPLRERQIGCGSEALQARRLLRISCKHLGEFGEPFVEPGVLVGILAPVDQVLEFMGQDGVIGVRAGQGRAEVHHNHGTLVAGGIDRTRVLVRRCVVASDVRQIRVQDGQARVAVHTQARRGAKCLAQGGIDMRIKRAGGAPQGVLGHTGALLDPHLEMRATQAQCRCDLPRHARMRVAHEKVLRVTQAGDVVLPSDH